MSINEFPIPTRTVQLQKILDAEVEAQNAADSAAAALTSEQNAATSETNAGTSASAALTSEQNALASEQAAATSEQNASTSETNAGNSAAAALTSEQNALASEQAASTSETNAATSEQNALASEQAAALSESNAATSEQNAATSETNALASEQAAATSETNAGISASAALTSEQNALASEQAAALSEGNAATSEQNALASEQNAASSASAALTSEQNAGISETNASNSAAAALTSEQNADASAIDASNSAAAALTSEQNASTSEANALTSEQNAATSETNAGNSASAALTSEQNAAGSASAALTSEQNALASEQAASTSEANALTSEQNAATSETNAEASLVDFEEKYLGAFASAPTVDNKGEPLQVGAIYFNTSSGSLFIWTGSEWNAAAFDVDGALVAINNLSDLQDASVARTNLGLGTAAVADSVDFATAAQGDLADTAVQPGDLSTVATTNDYNDLDNLPVLANPDAVLPVGGIEGQVLAKESGNDYDVAWIDSPSGISYFVKDDNYTAGPDEGVIAVTINGSWTLTLPLNPEEGAFVAVLDGGDWGINPLIVDRNGSTIEGNAENLELDIQGAKVSLVFDGTTWRVYAQIGAVSGNAVTVDATQTLTNKTIDGDDNTLVNVSKIFQVTVEGSDGTSDWAGSDPSIATITVAGLLASDVPIVDLDLSSVLFADVEAVQTDWASVYRVEASDDDELKLYATAEPAESFELTIKVVR
jgi:hypothetical protein